MASGGERASNAPIESQVELEADHITATPFDQLSEADLMQIIIQGMSLTDEDIWISLFSQKNDQRNHPPQTETD